MFRYVKTLILSLEPPSRKSGKLEGKMLQKTINQFRDELYEVFKKRADASLELIDALASAQRVESPVSLSLSEVFRRGYASVYDSLDEGEVEDAELRRLLYEWQPKASEQIAGYEIYASDATKETRAAAKTLADRTTQKTQANAVGVAGHQYQWLTRLVTECKSWVAPQAVDRVASNETANEVAARQVQRLDQCSPNLKVVVADSGYVSKVFLAAFVGLFTVVLLIRLRSNQALYGSPAPRKPNQRGAPAKHGIKYKLGQMPAPDREQRCQIGKHTVVLQMWMGLHLKVVAALVGMVICVTVLNAAGKPKFKNPLWLFWTGAPTIELRDIARMYFWRFCIEHFFRFMKQHMGLCACNATSLQAVSQWMRLCMLAYWQLLLSVDLALPPNMPWRKVPTHPVPQAFSFTPRQVQLACHDILNRIGTPTQSPRPAGKAPGRALGFNPSPRIRYPIIYKSKKPATPAPTVT